MTTTVNLPIDNNLLAAYLDGNLDESQAEYVENAIENSPELQWTVDRWLESQTGQMSSAETEISVGKAVAIHPKFRQMLSWAASILIVVVLTVPLLLRMGSINPNSGMSESFPASNNHIPLEHSTSGNILPIDPAPLAQGEGEFKWRYVIYKTSLIIMWEQRMEAVNCKLYSSQGNELMHSDAWNSYTSTLPLASVKESDKPLWLSVRFQGSGIIVNDSIQINY